VSRPATSSDPDGPLAGLRVVELSERVAGAYCGKLLVDAGAEVVKVESPAGDPLRRWTVGGSAANGDGPLFHYLAAGKRSCVLASRPPKGRPERRQNELFAGADIVVLTATPAVAARLGVDADVVLGANPAAVLVTISDFGWTGPWAERPATEFTLQVWCGATGFRGVPERPPVSVGGGVGEYVGGACAAAGGLAAWRRAAARGVGDHVDVSLLECMTLAMQAFEWLHVRLMDLPGFARSIEVPSIEPAKDGWVALARRDQTGEGALVELPMVEVALNVTAEQVIAHEAHGVVLERDGNRGPAAAPQNVYACAGEEQWVALAVAGDDQWAALQRVLGDPAWAADASLETHEGRRAAHDVIDRELEAWCARRGRDVVVERLAAAGIPAAPVVLPPDVVDNLQLRARGFFETLDHPCTGPTEYAGLPFARLRGVDRWCRRAAPGLGEHNDDVLGGELGLTSAELARLRETKVIGDRPAGL
jgi:crotonobetainyl-CoA:carnitine CoA-transferase CaiB-like acyl-CoA transferase